MRRTALTPVAGILIVCACGGRTPIEDYGYQSSSRTSVLNTGGEGGNDAGGSGGRDGTGATGVGGDDDRPPSPTPPQRPPTQQPPSLPPPAQTPSMMPDTCGQVEVIFEGQYVAGLLSANPGPGSFQSNCGGMGLEQHYSFVAPYTGIFSFDTLGSAFDTVLSVHDQDCFGTELICNDDNNGVASHVEIALTSGQQVTIRIDDYASGGGDYILRTFGVGDLSCSNYDLGSSIGASVAAESLNFEPFGQETVCGGAGPTFAARWTAPYEGDFQFDTIGSTFDSVLAVLASCDGEALACNDDFSGLASGVNLHLFSGQTVLLLLQALGGNAQPGNDNYVLNIQEIIPLP